MPDNDVDSERDIQEAGEAFVQDNGKCKCWTSCMNSYGKCYNCFCNYVFAPIEERWYPIQWPPRRYIFSRIISRLDPNAYNPFDEFYSLHESYQFPVYCFGALLTIFAALVVAFFTYLMYSNYAKNFSPLTTYLESLDTSYQAYVGGCSDYGNLPTCSGHMTGNIFVGFMLKSGLYLGVDQYNVTFHQKYQWLNGTTESLHKLEAASNQAMQLIGQSISCPVYYIQSPTNSFMEGTFNLNGIPSKIIEIRIKPATNSTYQTLVETMDGGSVHLWQYFGGNPGISSEGVPNPTVWRVNRYPWSNYTTTVVSLLYYMQTMVFTSRLKYTETSYDIISEGTNLKFQLTVPEATVLFEESDLLFVAQLSLDPAAVRLKYQRVAIMDYMSMIGGVAFLTVFCLYIVKCLTTDRCFEIEKKFIPRKSAFERLVRKKQEELEYYRILLLINPRVAKQADPHNKKGISPKDLYEYLKFKEGEEMSRFLKSLERAFVFQQDSENPYDPLVDKRKEIREKYGDQVIARVNFQYSNETLDVDEKETVIAKIVNIITAEKLLAQIKEINNFVRATDSKLKADAKL